MGNRVTGIMIHLVVQLGYQSFNLGQMLLHWGKQTPFAALGETREETKSFFFLFWGVFFFFFGIL